MAARPEDAWQVRIENGAIYVRTPDRIDRVDLANLTRILVWTDHANLGLDAWFIFEGETESEVCSFPLGANGQDTVLDELKRRLPDFEIRGMNSVAPARFECWSRKSY